MLRKSCAFLASALSIFAAAGAFQPPVIFHSGTRLVEVEVVVRTKDGPVKNLTKDDFTILDQGKPQRLDIFRAGPSVEAAAAIPLPPGAVSNRVNAQGQSLPSATVVLFDQLNTRLDLKGYERQQFLQFMRTLNSEDHVAIYSLGKNLHVLQDFTDDPAKLLNAVANLDPGRDLQPANIEDALSDLPVDLDGNIESLNSGDPITDGMAAAAIANLAGLTAQVYASNNAETTVEALKRIVAHLSGMPGRRNLIWVKEHPNVPPAVLAMLQQANISLYPVLVRSVLLKNDIFAVQHAAHDLGTATGGAAFNDAGDLRSALQTAQEDSSSSYTLGYYPAENALDGKAHRLSVKLTGQRSGNVEIRYRPFYLATPQPLTLAPRSESAALDDFVQSSLDATALGLTALFEPDPVHPGTNQLRLAIDLHDVHLDRQGDRSTGNLELAVQLGPNLRTTALHLDFSDEHLAAQLKTGYVLTVSGLNTPDKYIRILVRDPATGAAGSVKLPKR